MTLRLSDILALFSFCFLFAPLSFLLRFLIRELRSKVSGPTLVFLVVFLVAL